MIAFGGDNHRAGLCEECYSSGENLFPSFCESRLHVFAEALLQVPLRDQQSDFEIQLSYKL